MAERDSYSSTALAGVSARHERMAEFATRQLCAAPGTYVLAE